jgi:WD40 repeat protein
MKRAIFFSSFSSQLWALPEGAVARLGFGVVNDVKFSPDGKMLAIASGFGIYLYDPIIFIRVGYLADDSVKSIAFSPDGLLLASGNSDVFIASVGTIILWDMKPYIQKPATYPCDVNSDGIVNILDLVIVSKNFGKSATNNAKADVNKDGVVDILDLDIVRQHFGQAY